MHYALSGILACLIAIPCMAKSPHSEGGGKDAETEWKPKSKRQLIAYDFLVAMGARFESEEIKILTGYSTPGRSSACVITPGASGATRVTEVVITGLNLTDKPINEDAIEAIKEFPFLMRLDLSYSKVTDTSLVELIKELKGYTLKNLVELNLSNTAIGDAGVAYLKRFEDLEILDLSNTRVSNKGIVALKRLNELKTLRLASTKLTDHCTPALALMTQLEQLELSSTGVSNRGLPYIAKLRRLKALSLSGTRVSTEGKVKLRKVLKGCQVS